MDWGQLRTILWLRWRLSRNQWSRGGLLNAVLSVVVAVALVILAIGSGVAGVLVGFLVLTEMSPAKWLIVWDVIAGLFLTAWMIGLVSEIQRSETIDIGRMLHLPVSLKDVFLINYIASHVTLSIILFLPLTLGLCLGLILGRGGFMIALVPLVLGFVCMITAWTYCLRGWIVTLMVNKRRRRTIIAGITFGFILLSQLPYLIGNLQHDRRRHRPKTKQSVPSEEQKSARPASSENEASLRTLLLAHKVVPFLWVGNGAMALAQGNLWPAVLGAAGGFGIGALGLRRAYRSTVRFYQGQATGRKIAKRAKAEKLPAGRNLLEKQLPGVPEEASAAALAFFRSLWRAPEVKMALATHFIMLIIFGVMIFARRTASLGDNFRPFVATGAVVFMSLGMGQIACNHFGFDRGGFRTLVLLPAPRKYILLGKNLAFLPIALGTGLVFLALVKIAMSISPIVFLATGLQLVAAFLLLSMTGNLFSVLAPFRVASGSLKPTKSSAKTSLFVFLSRLLFPTVMAPIFFPAAMGLLWSHVGWLSAGLANLLLSAVLLAILVFLYRLSLNPLGNLLQQREKEILQVVTREVE
ncbi:MAG: ABC transporter permease [Sedimentisphaerales bacterium]|jgi:ABC-2 type transport system permease protein